MANTDKLVEFFQEVESDVTDRAKSGSDALADFRESSFTAILAEDLESEGIIESPVICYCESGRGAGLIKVNGYSVPDEDTCLDLLVTLYNPPSSIPAVLNSGDIETTFNRAEKFLSKAVDGLHEQLDVAGNQYLMASRIHGLRDIIDRVNFIMLTNGRLSQRRPKTRKQSVCGYNATYEVWDIERLRRLRETGTTVEAVVVDLKSQPLGGLPCTRLPGKPDGMTICVTIFPGDLLCSLYDEYGSNLLELNVRSYLQAKGKINKGILETLKNKPDDFLAYNNGITIVAEDLQFGKLKNGNDGILSMRGMQIVNGGQTTASIHKAGKETDVDLSRVFVQGKVTVVSSERFSEVVPRISLFSNSENKVSQSDLSSNHPFHVGFERTSRKEWSPDQKTKWFYERARGSYQTAKSRERTPAKIRDFEKTYPPQQRFNKEDLAKFEHAWRGLPYFVSRGGQKNFTLFMRTIDETFGKLPEDWIIDAETYRKYVAKGILYRSVLKIVKSDPGISAYQIDVCNYTVALMAEKTARRIDLDAIWKQQKISGHLASMACEWAKLVFQHLPQKAIAEKRHVQESFKNVGCWDSIRELNLVVPDHVEKELTESVSSEGGLPEIGRGAKGSKNEILRPVDQNNIARCKEFSQSQWLKIAEWGKHSGELAEWERGISRTLAGYAAEGWARNPTVKQAKFGSKMIALARDHGLFVDAG